MIYFNELIDNYFEGKLTKEEELVFKNLMKQSEELEEMFFFCKIFYQFVASKRKEDRWLEELDDETDRLAGELVENYIRLKAEDDKSMAEISEFVKNSMPKNI